MGLFKWFFKSKPKVKKEEENPSVYVEKEEKIPKIERIGGVVDCCEQILEVNRQIEQMKVEYQAVTSYLTDIQKIDLIPPDERTQLEVAAQNITVYTKEREKYKVKESKLTTKQRDMIEKQEDGIVKDLDMLKKNEEYNGIIKQDLHHLEGEKGALLYEQEEVIEKQNVLKRMSITMIILVVSIFALLAALCLAFEKNMIIPYILTILMAAITITYIFIEETKNRRELKLIERKRHKAVALLNKVKIKYVNNMSLLEYSYEKYDVSSFAELEYNWKEYIRIKENEKKYDWNTEKLNESKELLKEELSRYQLTDVEIWTHQAQAILDKREMVEVRHRLNIRRQKLRDNLDYNAKTYAKNKTLILNFMKENKTMQEEIKDILRNYAIEL